MNEKYRKQKTAIRRLFTRIATHYDRMNRLLSLGQDCRWRRAALQQIALPPGGKLLDVATGTGDTAFAAFELFPDSKLVGIDLTPAMVRQAQAKTEKRPIDWGIADGLTLPFSDNTFDAVISSFMLRNVPDVLAALREQQRVVRPEGRVVCLEITWPHRFPMSLLFHLYFFGWVPLLGKLLSGDSAAYQYLPRSVKAFMQPEAIQRKMNVAGLTHMQTQYQMLGTVAVYVGAK